jgi:ribonuclease BN (tRNA processing enzyme)
VYHSANHPSGGTHCYRFEYAGKKLVFATDTEGYVGGDTLLSRFARGADLFILDAEYTPQEYAGPPSRQGWGHHTWPMAVEVGLEAQVKQLALTHHNMDHDDAFLSHIEEEAKAVCPAAFVAREGTTIEL